MESVFSQLSVMPSDAKDRFILVLRDKIVDLAELLADAHTQCVNYALQIACLREQLTVTQRSLGSAETKVKQFDAAVALLREQEHAVADNNLVAALQRLLRQSGTGKPTARSSTGRRRAKE
jgi:hypothetical protein